MNKTQTKIALFTRAVDFFFFCSAVSTFTKISDKLSNFAGRLNGTCMCTLLHYKPRAVCNAPFYGVYTVCNLFTQRTQSVVCITMHELRLATKQL